MNDTTEPLLIGRNRYEYVEGDTNALILVCQIVAKEESRLLFR